MDKKNIPTICPSCGKDLRVTRLICGSCTTAVEGHFALPVLARLSPEDQEFLLVFIKSNGSLKDLARVYGISYPTVRNRLDGLMEKIKKLESEVNSEK
jgi:hypothetical protein